VTWVTVKERGLSAALSWEKKMKKETHHRGATVQPYKASKP